MNIPFYMVQKGGNKYAFLIFSARRPSSELVVCEQKTPQDQQGSVASICGGGGVSGTLRFPPARPQGSDRWMVNPREVAQETTLIHA